MLLKIGSVKVLNEFCNMDVANIQCISVLFLILVWKEHPENHIHRLKVEVCLPITYRRDLQGAVEV